MLDAMSWPASIDTKLADQDLTAGQRRKEAEFQRRLAYVMDSYRLWSQAFGEAGTFNDSLSRLKRAVRGHRPDEAPGKRLHPLLEAAIGGRAKAKSGSTTDPWSSPTCSEVAEACDEVANNVATQRGRPANSVLIYHVQALMLLWEWATGEPVTASRTTNSVYDPQMTSDGAKLIEHLVAVMDPTVSRTTLVNIVRSTRASDFLEGKSFRDLFPFHGGHMDEKTGLPQLGPGRSLRSFEVMPPIYCP